MLAALVIVKSNGISFGICQWRANCQTTDGYVNGHKITFENFVLAMIDSFHQFSNFPRKFLNFFIHKNLLLAITNTTKNGLSKSVLPFTRDAGNKDSFSTRYVFVRVVHS